jgi:prepilin-type processing-associated H-X9-DG protein
MWDGALYPSNWTAIQANLEQGKGGAWVGKPWLALNDEVKFSDPSPLASFDAHRNDVAAIDRNGHDNPSPAASDYMGKYNKDFAATADPLWDWGNGGVGIQRYRHLGNTSCNILFFDGHVEPRKLGTVLLQELCVFPN